MAFWGWVFLGSTLWVLTVRRDEFGAPEGGILSEMGAAYKEMVLVVQLPSVRLLTLVLLTCKAPLAAFDALIPFELLNEPIKVPKEHLATLTTIMLPVGMLTQAYVSNLFADSKPMSIWLLSYKARLAIGVALVGFVVALRMQTSGGGAIAGYMYAFGLVIMVASSMVSSAMFVAQMAFYNRVSDQRIGGTYMTMLNTFSNLGGQWPGTVVLALKGFIEKSPGLDSFTLCCGISAVLGGVWLLLMAPLVTNLQERPIKAWHAS